MVKQHLWKLIVAIALVATLAAPGVSATPMVSQTSPPNDNFASATVISALPFSDTVNNTGATTEFDEPEPCYYSIQTVWYTFTPTANATVIADMEGSTFVDTVLNVYQAAGPGFSGLSFVGCTSFGGDVTFNVQAGTTYYFQAGNAYNGGGDLHMNLQELPPPPNDDFANATVIPSLPFSDRVGTARASAQAGEPTPSCAYYGLIGTVWYAFTPATSGSVSANTNASFSTMLAAYTGNSLTDLTLYGGCVSSGPPLTFHVDAGMTYYFQAGNLYPWEQGGPMYFILVETPPPDAGFYFYPFDPSVFDSVQFNGYGSDPVGIGILFYSWDFGDGTSITTTDCCPIHRYAKDGDYTVELTVTTLDGRTASTSQTVQVKTHDVAITKFSAPQSASAGQTRQLVVGINSKIYAEKVRVEFFKSVPGGYTSLGYQDQSVPVRSANRTTNFQWSYTFTKDDATIGKVTFKAVATILEARDALPADNEAIASPTKVGKK
jgi:PKD repeat protein